MIIDDNRKIVGVCVAKTGSTTLRRALSHFPPDPPPEIYHMFLRDILTNHPHTKDYFKFAFVRDPYTRIHSVYCDFKYSNHGRSHIWATELKACTSFEDFVTGLETRPYRNYMHLQPQTEYLRVGNSINLDFLGRYEQYEAHCRILFSKLGIKWEDAIRNSERHLPPKKRAPQSTTLPNLRFAPKVEPCVYTDQMKQIMYRLYKEDFDVLGYTP
jgi:hypothetical protein